MSLKSKRRTILLEPEINDLFGAPKLTFEQKRLYFSLNDPEVDTFNAIRDRYNGIYFVLLLGYFKVKPVILNISYSGVRDDLEFIANELFPGVKLKRKNLLPAQKTRTSVPSSCATPGVFASCYQVLVRTKNYSSTLQQSLHRGNLKLSSETLNAVFKYIW